MQTFKMTLHRFDDGTCAQVRTANTNDYNHFCPLLEGFCYLGNSLHFAVAHLFRQSKPAQKLTAGTVLTDDLLISLVHRFFGLFQDIVWRKHSGTVDV